MFVSHANEFRRTLPLPEIPVGNVGVVNIVADPDPVTTEQEPYLLFNGCRLIFFNKDGVAERGWDAGSGVRGSTSGDQTRRDYGPLPSTATYTVGPAESQHYIRRYDPIWSVVSVAGVSIPTIVGWKPVLQNWARGDGREAWGNWRTRLRVRSGTTNGRDGFYIHGGNVCGSAGCLDLTYDNDRFHEWFKAYGRRLMLKVEYSCSPW